MKPVDPATGGPRARPPAEPAKDARTREHDLRNLLYLISSATQLVRGGQAGPVTAEQARFLDHVIECAAEVRRMLDEDRAEARSAGHDPGGTGER